MKNFRVWEANRKVFLFPENWLEPELRDDKSEFYRQLESDLLQGDVTHELGLEAFKSYVEKLGDISRITIVGMHDDGMVDGVRVVHVLGRDSSSPHRYLYRQWRIPFDGDGGYWSPWEEVGAGIDSEHVLLFRFAGSIHVAWPTIKPGGSTGPLTITMNVVKRRQAGWAARKTGEGSLSWVPPANINESRGLVFRLEQSSGRNIQINCYCAGNDSIPITQPRPIEFSIIEKNPNPAQDAPRQQATLSLRNLVRYKDTNSREYYYIADIPISLTAYARIDKDSSIVGRLPQEGTKNGEINERIDMRKILLFSQDIQDVDEVFKIDYQVLVRAGDDAYKPIVYKASFEVDQAVEIILSGDILVEPQNNESLTTKLFPPDRAISVNFPLGSFSLDDRGAFRVNDTPIPARLGIDANSRDVEDFQSNYLEKRRDRPGDQLLMQHPQATLLRTTPGLFSITEARFKGDQRPAMAAAYSDNDYDLVFRTDFIQEGGGADSTDLSADPPFAVVPASATWTKELREALEVVDIEYAGSLQSIPERVSVDVGDGIDSTRSITDIGIAFESRLPWASYNWETFFHIPVGTAVQLTRNNRYAEAQRWLHLVFDPTYGRSNADGANFWRFKPFAEAYTQASKTEPRKAIELELLELAAGKNSRLDGEIKDWREHPFAPHLIARSRIRPYQIFVVRTYLDNLLAWGDDLFRRDTIESINEATQHYLLAAEILGRRPQQVSTEMRSNVKTYRLLRSLDAFSNALVELESMVPTGRSASHRANALVAPSGIYSLYFGIPPNESFLSYWDTVADRLFKIRHSLNIEGVRRKLALYEPPIDPALLVRAVAAGVDIASALADEQGVQPLYRFNVVAAKALEIANDVKAYGAGLLSAIEKHDGESLSRLRSTQEIAMLGLVSSVKEQQRDEAAAAVAALRKSRELVAQRYLQYQTLLGKGTVEIPAEGTKASLETTPTKAAFIAGGAGGEEASLALAQGESDHLAWMNHGNNYTIIASSLRTASSAFHAVPTAIATPMGVGSSWGGGNLGNAAGAIGDFFQVLAGNANYQGTRSATIAGHQRRFDEWAFQSNLAAKELEQIDAQIAAGDLRVAIAKLEVTNHKKQMAHASEVDTYMRDKFSNAELYRWMRDQSAGMHYVAYQLAYKLAKQAEQAYRFDLGLESHESQFIRFGQWDGMKKGLLAGEMLALDIKRMEITYLQDNRRELEVTKHVSLRQLDGDALIRLRATGECSFELPEALFDLDFPGHYFRRIKSISISVPCVTGPYTSVNGTLTLESSRLRPSPVLKQSYSDESNYRPSFRPLQSIATSSGQNDSGTFELNFRDERYLPFEGAGVISRWRFVMPSEFRSFDYDTISDLVIHVRYTARDGGELLAKSSQDALVDQLNTLARGQEEEGGLLTVSPIRQDFATEWRAAISSNADAQLQLTELLFPFMFRGRVKVKAATFYSIVRKTDGTTELTPYPTDPLPDVSLPSITLTPKVAQSSRDPWLVIRYHVDVPRPAPI